MNYRIDRAIVSAIADDSELSPNITLVAKYILSLLLLSKIMMAGPLFMHYIPQWIYVRVKSRRKVSKMKNFFFFNFFFLRELDLYH